ncbi:hypothetical protein JYU34_008842 [Plutella xylostella]|uniref:CCD97-like C-terminal domain-containing protein n=1 Tax=Plutella xylostella TaxID=51655 RepID=A0ABQ7QLY3_PLUXY|nr:hypothetical protein JYU34_008842 [Plutella xylostella]
MDLVSDTTLSTTSNSADECEDEVDPIHDIIDYLIRCANISFRNAHIDEAQVRTSEKKHMALDIYKKSISYFLLQFGKYLAPQHLQYFEKLPISNDIEGEKLKNCVKELKRYHSEDVKRKRIRNRRYQACLKLQEDSDYFSEKEMMFRNPLLYEQLVGQYLTDEEIRERDGADAENLTFLNMILETVDRNEMRQSKNEQMLNEDEELGDTQPDDLNIPKAPTRWGEFETPDTQVTTKPEKRKQNCISAPERQLLRQEFLQEMYNSFIDGRDVDIDYTSIDNNEQYDDLKQLSQDAEDKYFDSETTDVDNLEEHMKLVEVYGKKSSGDGADDTLDIFMDHLNKRHVNC